MIVHSTRSSALTVECSPRSGPKIQQRSMANICSKYYAHTNVHNNGAGCQSHVFCQLLRKLESM